MLVKELIEVLQDCDGEDIVILATDAEGNDYKELADYNETDYYWYGDALTENPVEAHKALVLWPN